MSTPLLTRVFRSIDHAVPVMRTLRTYQAHLIAEGKTVPLDSDDDWLIATIQAAISAYTTPSTRGRNRSIAWDGTPVPLTRNMWKGTRQRLLLVYFKRRRSR